ncbi:MAG: hypothetical protein GF344_19950 [Chitinivibrionales bacterium]|nr:hypothetical protein [Chitinivibrionales bacterium]MBD3358887.1 hypothetical protein [Chitinivibrionales bacterium]
MVAWAGKANSRTLSSPQRKRNSMDAHRGRNHSSSYERTEPRDKATGVWLFRAIMLASLTVFIGLGLYFRTVEPPPERFADKDSRIRTRFLIEEQKKPTEKKTKPQEKPAEKKERIPEENPPDEPVDLTKKPKLDQERDDIQDKKPKRRRVRRVYGLKKVYSKGLGSGGDMADAVIGKRGNTLNKEVDTLTATDAEIKGEIVSTTTVTSMPRYKKRAKPEYTKEMLENEIEGKVKVKALVDTDGMVKKAVLLNDLGYGSGKQARNAALEFEFHPAMRGDEPVAVWIVITIRFVLLG